MAEEKERRESMYLFKNAITSIVRNKGRNFLIGIIIMVLACAVSVTLAIHHSAKTLIESYESKYELQATLGVDRSNMMGKFNPEDRESSKEQMDEIFSIASKLSISDVENYGDSEYVKDLYYTRSLGVNSDSLEKAEMTFGNGDPGFGGKSNFDGNTSDFTLKGYSSIESMQEFIGGSYTITEGEVSEDFESNDCMINSELATLNDISVGDTIKVTDGGETPKEYELEITGIYKEKEEADAGMNMFANSANTIITNVNVISQIADANDTLRVNTSPTFVLTSRDVVEEFTAELKEKGLNEYLTVETNLEQIENATNTIVNVKTFAVTFLAITLVIGTIVLLVINMINLRERKYEIGVLRTIGMKKWKVCLQFLYELLIVSFFALMIGAAAGSVMSVPVSNRLLEKEITASQEENEAIRNNFGKGDRKFGGHDFSGVAAIQAVDHMDAVVDVKVLMELLGLGLIITLISGSSSMISIQKFSPLTILKERS